jgi:predicted RecA/RadA family phage recombinase
MAQTLEAIFYRGDNQNRKDFTPSGSSPGVGKVIDIGGRIGVVTSPQGLSDGVLGSVADEGVFKLKKAVGTGVTFAQGVSVFWDTVNLTAVAAAGANIIYAGVSDEAAVTGDDHVKTDVNKLPSQNITGI